MADLISIGTAVESYRADRGAYPEANSIEELRSALEPHFIAKLPASDGWGHPFAVRTTAGSFLVFSLGKDGVGMDCSPGQTIAFADQICFADGQFVRYPEGLQR
jgi:hypothetical protein